MTRRRRYRAPSPSRWARRKLRRAWPALLAVAAVVALSQWPTGSTPGVVPAFTLPTASTSVAPAPPAPPAPAQGARAQLAAVQTNDTPLTGAQYDRDQWGRGWADLDGDGCDTRQEILERDSLPSNPVRCVRGVLPPGGRWSLVYVEGETTDPRRLDIDHVVALEDAHRSGAAGWSAELRRAFANDPDNLLAVDLGANRSKGSKGLDEWTKGTAAGRCRVATQTVTVALRYNLTVTTPERDAIGRALDACPGGTP